MIEFGVITAPRGVPCIGESLSSFFDTWPNHTPHVFMEPGMNGFVNQSKIIEHNNERTLGCVGNWLAAATWMHENTKSPFVAMLEDDITWQLGAKERVTNLLKVLIGEIINEHVKKYLPPIGVISPYCSKMNAVPQRGWQRPLYKPKTGWCGTLCMIMPRASLTLLLENRDKLIETSKNKSGIPTHLDFALVDTFIKLKLIILTHLPTLVLHIGDVSTFEAQNKNPYRNVKSRSPAL